MNKYTVKQGRPVGNDGPRYRTLGIPVSDRELSALELINRAAPGATGGTIAGAVRYAIHQAARQIVNTRPSGGKGENSD